MDTLSLNTHNLLEEAKKSTAITGNITAIFAMLILRDILAYEAATNPIDNLSNIISISNSIAYLNTSIKTIVRTDKRNQYEHQDF
jgi:hypothetical protein